MMSEGPCDRSPKSLVQGGCDYILGCRLSHSLGSFIKSTPRPVGPVRPVCQDWAAQNFEVSFLTETSPDHRWPQWLWSPGYHDRGGTGRGLRVVLLNLLKDSVTSAELLGSSAAISITRTRAVLAAMLAAAWSPDRNGAVNRNNVEKGVRISWSRQSVADARWPWQELDGGGAALS